MKKVALYEFLLANGAATGVGTEREFRALIADKVLPADCKLGAVLGYEYEA